jgi:hypothetical protein
MSEQTDATEDRSGDEDVDRARNEREEPAESEGEAERPQPWAKALPGEKG